MNSDVILMKRILGKLESIEKEIISLNKKFDTLENQPGQKSGQ